MSALKGRLLVAQSGGPTAVINSSICGVVQEALRHECITGVYGALHGIEGVLSEEIVDLGAEDPAEIELLKKTPSAALFSCRHKVTEEEYDRILEVLEAHEVRYFLYAGGNDSMDTCAKVARLAVERGYELRAVGIPKTIDNDLAFTDHCPGYGSVARWLAVSVRDAGLDTEAIYTSDRIKIVETMGRNAGWITASTALAKESLDSDEAPHLIYLPEVPWSEERFLADVERVYSRLGRVFITVCEGLRDVRGEYLTASSRSIDTDSFGHRQLGGVAAFLCDLIAEKLKIKARFDKPGTIQRVSGLCQSPQDVEEAYEVGRRAVELAVAGESGKMVTIERTSDEPYRWTTGTVELERVANAEHKVPREYINEAGNGVTEAFLRYARPLIGGPLHRYARLRLVRVPRKVAR